jgi:hypothetical protein
MKVRTFGGVLENGTNGAPYASTSRFVNRSWEIVPLAAGAVVDMTLQWNGTNENTSFQRSGAKTYHNDNASGGWAALPSTTAMGTNPYQVTAAGVSSFSTFAVGSAGPLPVELVSFGAQRASATAVLVAWATVTEINCGHFDIERSADGQQFQRFGAVACGGSSSQSRAYTFRDEAAAGAAYYRLHQVDTDGQAQYSPVVYVAGLGTTGLALSIFPNPTTGTVTLVGAPAATPLLLSLRNALGQVMLPACPGHRGHSQRTTERYPRPLPTWHVCANGRMPRPASAPKSDKTIAYQLKPASKAWLIRSRSVPLCPQAGNVTERLGRGLQNLLRRFESARYLQVCPKALLSQ